MCNCVSKPLMFLSQISSDKLVKLLNILEKNIQDGSKLSTMMNHVSFFVFSVSHIDLKKLLKYPFICKITKTDCCIGPWCWRWRETVEGPDNGESNKISRCLSDSSEYHDLSSHAKGCLHRRRYRESVTICEVPSTEHTLSTVWPCLQGWPTWRWG